MLTEVSKLILKVYVYLVALLLFQVSVAIIVSHIYKKQRVLSRIPNFFSGNY